MDFRDINLTLEEWEAVLGEHVRAARIEQNLDQAGLAQQADVSIGAISNLERGKGSSLRTLIAVIRALGRTDWLDALAPSVTVSPLHMLRTRQRSPRSRVRTTARQRETTQHS